MLVVIVDEMVWVVVIVVVVVSVRVALVEKVVEVGLQWTLSSHRFT